MGPPLLREAKALLLHVDLEEVLVTQAEGFATDLAGFKRRESPLWESWEITVWDTVWDGFSVQLPRTKPSNLGTP